MSDDMIYIPIENLRPKAPILRLKRHDSFNGIIAETRLSSQHLDALPALRDMICGFFAASSLAPDGILCKQATVTESTPTALPPGRHNDGRPVNLPVIKRPSESR